MLISAAFYMKQDSEDTEDVDLSFGGGGSSSIGCNNPMANACMVSFGAAPWLAGALMANWKMKIC